MTGDATKVRPTAAERMRLHRARRRRGLRCVRIILAGTEVDALIHKGLLTEEQRDYPEALEGAVCELLLQVLE